MNDADPGRARRTEALLRHLAPHLGLQPDAVRVDVDTRATARTRAHGARGLAAGGTVYLDPTRYRPDTAAGRGLLAHEVAHVAQQAARGPLSTRAAAEAEAARAAADAAAMRAPRRPRAVLGDAAVAADTGADVTPPVTAEALEPYRRWRQALAALAEAHGGTIAAVGARLTGAAVSHADVEAVLQELEPLPLDEAAAVVHAVGDARTTLVDRLSPGQRRRFRPQVLAAYAGLEPDELRQRDERLFDGLSLDDLDGDERRLAVVVLLDLSEATLLALLADKRLGPGVRALMTTGVREPSEPEPATKAPDEDDPILVTAAKRITRERAREIYDALMAVPDAAMRRGLIRALDARGRLDLILERLPRDVLFAEGAQVGLGTLLAARERTELVRHVRALMSRRDLDVTSREAYLALLMLRELPVADQQELALADRAGAQLGERLEAAGGLHMLPAPAAAAQREQLLRRLDDPDLWTPERAAELETLIRMATLLGIRHDVVEIARRHDAGAVEGLEEVGRLRRARPGEALGVLRGARVATAGLGVLAGGEIFVDVDQAQMGAHRLPLRATQRALGTVAHGVQLARGGGANRADFQWDGERLSLKIPQLELASVNRAGPGWSLHAGAVHGTDLELSATFPGGDFSRATEAELKIASLVVEDAIGEWRNVLAGAAKLDLKGLHLTGDVGIEPPRSPMRVPLLDRASEILAAGMYAVTLGVVTAPRALAAELVTAASRLGGVRLDLESADLEGISLGAVEQATTVAVRGVHAAAATGERVGTAALDIGTVAVRGATGAVHLPPLTFADIHAEAESPLLARGAADDPDLARRFLAEGPAPPRPVAAGEIQARVRQVTIETGAAAPLTLGPLTLASGALEYDPRTGLVTFAGGEAAARDARLGVLDLGQLAARGFSGSIELLDEGVGLRLTGVHVAWLTLRELDWTARNGVRLSGAGPIHLLGVELSGTLTLDEHGAVQVALDRFDILGVEAEELHYAKGGLDLRVAAPLEVRDVRLRDVRWQPLGGVPTMAGTVGGILGEVAGSLASLELGGRLDTGTLEFALTEEGLTFETVEAAAEGARLGPLEVGDVGVRGLRATVEEVEGGLRFRDVYVPGLTLEQIAWSADDGTSITGPGPVALYHVRLTATIAPDAGGVPEITADPFRIELVDGRNLRYRRRGVDVKTTGEALAVAMHNVRWRPTAGLPTGTGTIGPVDATAAGSLFGFTGQGRAHADSIDVDLQPGEARLRARGVAGTATAGWRAQLAELEASGVDTGTVLITPQGITVGAEGRPLTAEAVQLRRLMFASGGLTIAIGGPQGLTLAKVRVTAKLEHDAQTAVRLTIDELRLAELGTQDLQLDGQGWSFYITAPAALKGLDGVVRGLVAEPVGNTWEAVSYGEVRLDRLDAVGARIAVWDIPAIIGPAPRLADVPRLLKPYEDVVETLIGHVKADVELPVYLSGTSQRVDTPMTMNVGIERGQVDLREIQGQLQPAILEWLIDFDVSGDRLFLVASRAGRVAPKQLSAMEWQLSPEQARRLQQSLAQSTAPAYAPLVRLADPLLTTTMVDVDLPNAHVTNIEARLASINDKPVVVTFGKLGDIELEPYGVVGLVLSGDLSLQPSAVSVGLTELRFESALDLKLAPLPPVDTGRIVMRALRAGTILFVDGWPRRFSGVIGVLEVHDIVSTGTGAQP